MSYLQVVCEQHRLVEQHLSKFTHPDSDVDSEVRLCLNLQNMFHSLYISQAVLIPDPEMILRLLL